MKPHRIDPDGAESNAPDGGLLLAAVVLIGLGVVMSYSTTAAMNLDARIPPYFLKHLGALLAGALTGGLAFVVPLPVWRRLAFPLWAISLVLVALTLMVGVEVNGARRWLTIPGLGARFQPVEPLKCMTILAVAALVSRRDGHDEISMQRTWIAGGLTFVPVLLLVGQPDLGNAVLLAVIVFLVLVVAGVPLRKLVAPGCAGVVAVAAYVIRNPYALRRVTGFLDPWENALDEGFQLVQSFVAFGRGGLLGVGLGNSQQKLSYLPEAHTDFILALVAEELGLVGVLVVLGAFAALLFAGTRIAREAGDRFTLLLAFGLTALLTVPALINGAVVMGLVPTKGLTLPFLSYGRTSLITSCFALGLLAAAGRRTTREARTVSWH